MANALPRRFSIRLLSESPSIAGGPRIGEITIDDFTEKFACYPHVGTMSELEECWLEELRNLVSGKPAVALVHESRLAWVFYREDEICYVRQVLSLDGHFGDYLLAREPDAEVSEWMTSISAIAGFLENSTDLNSITS